MTDNSRQAAIADRVHILKSVSVFARTPEDDLAEIAAILDEVHLPAGEIVFEKGDLGDCMYVLADGRVRVHDDARTLNLLGPGDVFGEMAALDPEPRVATVTVVEAARLFRLNQTPFYRLMSERPEVARGVIHVLIQYVRTRVRDAAEDFRVQLELERRVQEQLREISLGQLGTIFALSKLADSRDAETGAHLERIQAYCGLLAEQLRVHPAYAARVEERTVEHVVAASPLHDVGKVGLPDTILLKPGRLTDEERAVMQQHTRLGADTLRAVYRLYPGNEFIRIGIEIAESHHERWDGTGYPDRLAAEAIPLSARVLALADVYDALTSRRRYKEALSHEASRDMIVAGRGQHFDPGIVDCFLAVEASFQAVRARLQEAAAAALVSFAPAAFHAREDARDAAKPPDFEAARQYALARLEAEIPAKMRYHNLAHVRDEVVPAAERLAALEGVTGSDLLRVRTAAHFHDIGFVDGREEHEAASIRIAAETLPGFGYSPEDVQAVVDMIRATRLPQSPRNLLERVLADADLDVLGRGNFMARSEDLWHELAAFDEPMSKPDWIRHQIEFLRSHRYFTTSARALRETKKQENLAMLEGML